MILPLKSTYRVQFTDQFTFQDAEKLVPYWKALGISHLYSSPIAAARRGSQHGYDVVDPQVINPELGGERAFYSLAGALKNAGLGLVVDIVPNHMGIGDARNTGWLDALEFGRKGFAASTFDIDWERGPVLLPFLGDTLFEILARRELVFQADFDTPRFNIVYYDHVLPLRPSSVVRLFRQIREFDTPQLRSAIDAWAGLEDDATLGAVTARRQQLAALLSDSGLQEAIRRQGEAFVAMASTREDETRAVFDVQHWRLAFWRTGQDEVNYRRFFNISDLAAIRAELPAVFEATHRLPLKLVKEGLVDGLRVDHVDGLTDPAAYCARLREAVGPSVTIHIEKILDRDEKLRPWPVDGTTGYELLNLINALFIDPAGYRQLAGSAKEGGLLPGSVEKRVAAAKRKVLAESFGSELDKLTSLARQIAEQSLATREYSAAVIRRALSEMIVHFPVYRSYLTSGSAASPEDKELIDGVVAKISGFADQWTQRIVAFLRDQLIEGQSPLAQEFKARFQQLTSPVMAKGYEDTELYRHVVLLSVNEVGGQIAEPALDAAAFHRRVAEQARSWPLALVPMATHDTKRGAGARARINALSECAAEWLEQTTRWSELTQSIKTEQDGKIIPDPLDEELIYQTLIGSWPIDRERLVQYVTKAVKEAKRRTSWENPNTGYEEAIVRFATALVEDPAAASFRQDFESFSAEIVAAGRINSTAQSIVQFTFPGVPDLYWGTEFWDHAMVDPDNRRPVDWQARQSALAEITSASNRDGRVSAIIEDRNGTTKLAIIHDLLQLRQSHAELFTGGRYHPLTVAGEQADKWLAYARVASNRILLIIVPVRGLHLLRSGIDASLHIGLPAEWQGIGRDLVQGREVTLQPVLSIRELVGNGVAGIVLRDL